MIQLKYFFLGICLLIFSINSAIAESEVARYTVGVESVSYEPYYSVKAGKYSGFIPELLNDFAKKNNIEFSYQPLPIKRLHKQYLSGRLDFLYPGNISWIIDQKKITHIFYSLPVVTVIDGLMVKPENKGKMLSSLNKLGTISGYTAPPYQGLIDSGRIKFIEVNQFQNLLKMVINSRLDAAYVSINPGNYQLREKLKKEKALVFDDSLPYDHSQHVLSSLKHGTIIDQLNQYLLENQDFIKTLKIKYGIKEYR